MSKEFILRQISDEDKSAATNLYEKMKLAEIKGIIIFGNDFYPPNIWKVFEGTSSKYCNVESFGGFLDSERRMISFNNMYNIPYPLRVLEIKNNSKFKNLVHKDYLGSVMSLGITREKVGDLVIREDRCFIVLHEDIADFVLTNLEKIGNVPCKVQEYFGDIREIQHEFKEETILINSLRLDSIVSKITKKSRTIAQELINNGRVLRNYNIVRNKSEEVNIEDRITIRGYGKFVIGDVLGKSKSGKNKVIIKKYT